MTTVTEPVSGSYARVSFTNNKTNWSTSASGALANLVAVTFPQSGSSWGVIQEVFFSDASATSSGSVWYHYPLSSPVIVQQGSVVSFAIGSMTAART
jgi:hypothetical protein